MSHNGNSELALNSSNLSHKANSKNGSANSKTHSRKSHRSTPSVWELNYELMECRRVLAAVFPIYVNGVLSLGDPNAAAPYPLADTFNLATNPTATKTIYLDLNGHVSENNSWDHTITFPAFDRDGDPLTFADSELIEIQRMFQNVAEDFAPFDVNVTTTDPGLAGILRDSPGDTVFGIRTVITQATNGFGDNFGGIAFLNSFGPSIDDPAFVINKGVNVGALTISHEVGHTLGLVHDGLDNSAYHPGGGSGVTSWGPIMGAPFSANISQWSNSDYTGGTNTQDDYIIITSAQNGFGFRADDYGSTFGTATDLPLNGTATSLYGFVERRTDVDMFKFKSGPGTVTFDIKAFLENPNLDIVARIFNSSGTEIASSNPVNDVHANISVNVIPGTYYLSIDGTGKTGEYSDYGSVGFFSLTGTVPRPSTVLGESGTIVDLTAAWKTIALKSSYANPVVIMGTPSRLGADPVTIRVRNVKANSFEARVEEWNYQDGKHGKENVSFFVAEAGTYNLADGTIITAGLSQVTHRFKNIGFDDNADFGATPTVFAQVMTTRERSSVTTRLRSITSNDFQIRVQEEEAADRIHLAETVGWIAIENGQTTQGGRQIEVGKTPVAVTDVSYPIDFVTPFSARPGFIAQMQTYLGGDPATVRYNSLNSKGATFFLEEERSFDAEVAHNAESVGYLAIEAGEIVLPPEGMPPASMKKSDSYRNTDDPVRLAKALKIQQSWKDEIRSLANDYRTGYTFGNRVGLPGSFTAQKSGLSNYAFGLPIASSFLSAKNGTVPTSNRISTSNPITTSNSVKSATASTNVRADVFAELFGNNQPAKSVISLESTGKLGTI